LVEREQEAVNPFSAWEGGIYSPLSRFVEVPKTTRSSTSLKSGE
jgi:hypothetical protein